MTDIDARVPMNSPCVLKGHDFTGCGKTHALKGTGFCPRIRSNGKTHALKVTGFSPYIRSNKRAAALAAEGRFSSLFAIHSWFFRTLFSRAATAPNLRRASASEGRFIFRLQFLFALAFFLHALPDLRAQDNGPTFRMDVKLVNLFVNVTDKTGAIVGGLGKDDFQVFEDGRPQKISVFERQSELPLNLILAIDTSGSTAKDLTLEQSASKHFIHALLREQDQMSLIEFATDVRSLVSFTNKVQQLDRGLNALRVGDATALYDAIYLGSDSLRKKEGRKVLVLVSDGGDTVQSTTYDEALEQALRCEVMIYSIIDVPIEASAGRDIGGEHALITLSEQTGGKSFYATEGGLDRAFQKVSEDLRTQYLLGYYPHSQEPGRSFHRIQITVPRAAADAFNIRYKTGYYSEPPAPPRPKPVD